MARNSSSQKVANSLVAMSSAVVLAVYSAGYVRTRPAADRLAQQALQRTIARQAPPSEAAPDGPVATAGHSGERGTTIAAETSPAASTHSDPKATTAAAPKVTASAAPANAPTQIPSVAAAPSTAAASSPAETPAPVAAPVSVPVTSVAPVAEQTASVPAAAPVPASPKVWKDGKYVAWGGSRHGDIQATVVIESGHIVSAEISECQTRYSCDVIEKLPSQVIKRQSPNVDRVSGATESADAFYSAVYFALGQAH